MSLSSEVPFRGTFLLDYLTETPAALAIERTLECLLHAEHPFKRPVLDLGCGDGLFASILFREPLDTGIDPQAHELAHAERLKAYHETIACFGDRVPKPDASYQTIFSNSVLEHIPDLEPVLREMFRLLASKGRFYVTVPSRRFDVYAVPYQILKAFGLSALAEQYRKRANRFWNLHNLHTLEEWRGRFEAVGFKTIEAHEYDPYAICTLNGCLTPLALPSFITKKLTNRWTWWPALRRALFKPFAARWQDQLKKGTRAESGGLVYLAFEKP